MSKVYILQKDIDHPMWKISKGAKMIKHGGDKDAGYVCDNKWFVLHPDYVENNPEWFLPEENKSNDGFQWSADLVKEFCEYAGMRIGKNKDIRQQLDLLMEDFKQSHTPKPQAERVEKKLTQFEIKKIGQFWYCYATHRGYDHTFCSDNEYHAVELAKRIMDKNGWLAECYFPETLKTKPQAESKPDGHYCIYCNSWIEGNRSDEGCWANPKNRTSKPQPQKEEQRIEVKERGWDMSAEVPYSHCFVTPQPIPEDKRGLIIKAIESVLNKDAPAFDWMFRYTQSQVDKMCEDAFNAAREYGENFDYYNYQDYKDKQSKQ